MAPDRSTTRAVTDPARRRWRWISGALVALTIVVGVASGCSKSAPTATPSTSPAVAPLQVGDGRTVSLLSLGGVDTDEVLDRVAADIGAATERVEQFWGTDWAREIVVVATDSDQQFAAAAPDAPPGMAAVAVADSVDPGEGLATGQRIVLAPGAGRMSDAALRIVLTHELFHYAARAGTAADAPRWLTEGVADYVARPPADFPDLPAPTALPADGDFDQQGAQLSTAYDRAWLFARFVADRYGVSALRDLYTRAAGSGHADFAAALREVTGADPAQVLAQWRAWPAR